MTEDISTILAKARAVAEAAKQATAEKARLEEERAEQARLEKERAEQARLEAEQEEKNNSEIFRQNLAEYNDLSKKLNQLLSIAQSFQETLPALEKRKKEIKKI